MDVVTTVVVGVDVPEAAASELKEKLVFTAGTGSAGLPGKALGVEAGVTRGNARPNDGALKVIVGCD